ncbi:MAG TPA: M28 family metallopeptidase [Solirubrobacteraceae bacterium]|nr:M28 family metallopeptidase [Solirubrobacteraceae bacterium]
MLRERPWLAAAAGAALFLAVVAVVSALGTSSGEQRASSTAQAAAAEPTATTGFGTSVTPLARANRFDGTAAFALLREQVQVYGWRPAGSAALRRLAVRLRALLPRGRFEAIPGHPRLRNIVGTVPGRRPAIVVAAHYDVEQAPEGFVGANDGAAGTAAVVTLARAFAKLKRPPGARELRFVLFDGEEEPAGCQPFEACGIRGSRAYAERHAADVQALVLLDYIAEKTGLDFPRELGSDAAMWRQLRRAASDVGVGSLFGPFQSGQVIIDDHYPFTQRGIPAIDIIDFNYPQADTLQDDLDAVSRRSLDAVGEAVHLLISRLRRSG